MKVDILGTRYSIEIQSPTESEKLKECYGLCEQYSKKIILSDFSDCKENPMLVENFEEFRKKVLRHEIIHAFLGESGLRENCEYAENEELIDWIAIQFNKIHKAMLECNCL